MTTVFLSLHPYSFDDLLTKRELEVLQAIAHEFSSKEIAEKLGIALGTVESHRRNIFAKLSATNMAGAIHKAYQIGILKPNTDYFE